MLAISTDVLEPISLRRSAIVNSSAENFRVIAQR
jgi:hypothetical protein